MLHRDLSMSLTKGYRHYCNSTWPVELISEESLILTSFVKSLHRFAMRTRSISIEDFMKNKPNISNLKSFNHKGIKKPVLLWEESFTESLGYNAI